MARERKTIAEAHADLRAAWFALLDAVGFNRATRWFGDHPHALLALRFAVALALLIAVFGSPSR